MSENWDSVKKLIGKKERMKDIYTMEADYLANHPGAGYLTEILNLKSFPDYIDYLPEGAIVRKIAVMGYLPQRETGDYSWIGMSQKEYEYFVDRAIELVVRALEKHKIRSHDKRMSK